MSSATTSAPCSPTSGAPCWSDAEAARQKANYAALARLNIADYSCFAHRTKDGRPLVPQPFHEEWLRALTDDSVERLLLIAPPGHAKTTYASVVAPCWLLGHAPEKHVVLVSHAAAEAYLRSVAVRDTFAHNEYHQAAFPGVEPDWEKGWGEAEWFLQRANRGDPQPTFAAMGVFGPITGHRADLLILDDPCDLENTSTRNMREKVWRWWIEAAVDRVDPGGRVVCIMTRWCEDDLAGRFIAQGGWRVMEYRAHPDRPLWPAMYDAAFLEAKRREMGARAFDGRYMASPTALEGDLFKREWFGTYDAGDGHGKCSLVVQGWDTAQETKRSADYSACVTLGKRKSDGKVLVLDVWRGKVEAPALEDKMVALYEKWRPASVAVEKSSAGASVIQYIRREHTLPIVAVVADRDKGQRASGVAPICEAGQVLMPESSLWGGDFLDELCGFSPVGGSEHDDQVDAFVYAMQRMMKRAPLWGGFIGDGE
jgi:predicted phage terminase large subunit-like protein